MITVLSSDAFVILNRLMAIARCFKAPAIPHRKQTVIIPIPLASKQQKCSRRCPNKCINMGKWGKAQAHTSIISYEYESNRSFQALVWQASTM